MEVQEIIAELKNETKRLNEAIAALEGLGSRQSTTKNHSLSRPRTAQIYDHLLWVNRLADA